MNISIKQLGSGVRSVYEISAPGRSYRAEKKFFSFSDKVKIFSESGAIAARIQSRFRLFGSQYDFVLADGKVYRFQPVKIWKPIFRCKGNSECYSLYEHRKLRWSVFEGETQVAAFTKNAVKLGSADQYAIHMNANGNLMVVVCMVLVIDASEFENEDSEVTLDFGNIGPEGRKFDDSWEPK